MWDKSWWLNKNSRSYKIDEECVLQVFAVLLKRKQKQKKPKRPLEDLLGSGGIHLIYQIKWDVKWIRSVYIQCKHPFSATCEAVTRRTGRRHQLETKDEWAASERKDSWDRLPGQAPGPVCCLPVSLPNLSALTPCQPRLAGPCGRQRWRYTKQPRLNGADWDRL